MTARTNTESTVKPPLGIPPPLVALVLITAGLAIHLAFPQRLLPEGWIQFVVGVPLIGLGVALARRSLKAFQAVGTDERYAEPTSVIVQDGPYARSRNPMFLSLVLIYLGVVLAVNSAWALAGALVLILYLYLGVITREERFLEDRFGHEYASYRREVPRWIPRPKV